MKQAFIYTRVSTLRQANEGDSLEAQQARAIRWATDHGYEIGGIYSDEGISGKKMTNRPGLQAALSGACRPGNALVVNSLSRLARSTTDAIAISKRIEKAGADLVSLTEQIDTTSAVGRMVFRILASFDEFTREIIAERTCETLQHKASKGERCGAIPYGYKLAADGVRLQADPIERATLADLAALRSTGMSWQQIADEMNARGITTKKGRTWTWQTARKAVVLKRLERKAA